MNIKSCLMKNVKFLCICIYVVIDVIGVVNV